MSISESETSILFSSSLSSFSSGSSTSSSSDETQRPKIPRAPLDASKLGHSPDHFKSMEKSLRDLYRLLDKQTNKAIDHGGEIHVRKMKTETTVDDTGNVHTLITQTDKTIDYTGKVHVKVTHSDKSIDQTENLNVRTAQGIEDFDEQMENLTDLWGPWEKEMRERGRVWDKLKVRYSFQEWLNAGMLM
ncbi:MAG: hypothetical protein Q9169_008174 [Polycauliona sp. 2 TL-2023]